MATLTPVRKHRKPTALVVISPDDTYKRYEGRLTTHHVKATEGPMSAADVELFRTDPDSFFPTDEGGDDVA